jgi:hypothetical protein
MLKTVVKIFLSTLFLTLTSPKAYASDFIEIPSFEIHVLSKRGTLTAVEASFRIEGRDLEEEKYKIIDTFHTVIGGYILEDLFTSSGKEWVKKEFIRYMDKHYQVQINALYFGKFKIKKNTTMTNLIQALKDNGCCCGNSISKKVKQEASKNKFY